MICQILRINKEGRSIGFVFADRAQAVSVAYRAVGYAGQARKLARQPNGPALENRQLFQADSFFKFFVSAHSISAFLCCYFGLYLSLRQC